MKCEVDIFDISHSGAGVGKIAGKVIFVPFSFIGDKVEVKIVKETSSYMIGEILKIIYHSSQREKAPCPYFSVCGGCDFQHINREAELDSKRKMVRSELNKIGYNSPFDIISCEKRYGYRNKIVLHCVQGELGFLKANSHNFVKISNCILAEDCIQKNIPFIQNFIKNNNLKQLKTVTFRKVGQDVLVYLLFPIQLKNDKNLANALKKMPKISNFYVFLVFGEILEDVYDENSIDNKLFYIQKNSINLAVDAKSFLQVNDEISDMLYKEIIKSVEGGNAINAYSGQGLLSALLLSKCQNVMGIELNKNSHAMAEKMKINNNLTNLTNINNKVENVLAKILKDDVIDAVVLDPARAGCDKRVVDCLNKSKIKQIIYISCNFSTLVRDLKGLKGIYNIKDIKVFDMFPCTANVEVMAVLELKN